MSKNCLGLLVLTIVLAAVSGASLLDESFYDYPDYDGTEEPAQRSCDPNSCKLPNCSCFNQQPNVPLDQRPQFVMLTFDDAITVANIDTYKKIAKITNGAKKVRMTFFVSHEYNDYTLSNEMQAQGHEIAVHSVSHESNTGLWRDATEEKWKREMAGVRLMLGTFGLVPQDEIVGHRAPFLQTAGDNTFTVLKEERFLYDSSMPSRNYMDPPVWPYTLDYGFAQDCQIEPCPERTYPGLWEVPMIQYIQSSKDGDFYCSMADACTPYPKTAGESTSYFMKNFNRHYRSNKAPFPVFLHEGWLRDAHRLEGYLEFIRVLNARPDVFFVTVRDVVEYMKKPVTITSLQFRSRKNPGECKKQETCSYKEPLRIMKSCSSCPKYYPWVGTPLGKRPPVDFHRGQQQYSE